MVKATGKQSEIALFFSSLFPALLLLRRNDPLRMAGATAFFTTFGLPPIIFLLARLFGLIFGPRLVGRGLLQNLSNNLGPEGAQQVRGVIRTIRGFDDHWYVVVLVFMFLFFVATTLFMVIKNSINQIWKVPEIEHPGMMSGVFMRLRSFAVIMLVGILFFADLLAKSLEAIGGKYVEGMIKGGSLYFKFIFGELSGALIVAAWFIVLFRFITNGRPRWKAAIIGGLLTGVLFSAGRYLLRGLLVNGNVGKLYGASGSFVLVLLFVFYTSFILYFGASFIAVYSDKKKWPLFNKPAEKL